MRGGGGEGKCSACMHVHTYVRMYVCMYTRVCVRCLVQVATWW